VSKIYRAFKKQGNREQGIGNREEDLSLFLLFVAGGASPVGGLLRNKAEGRRQKRRGFGLFLTSVEGGNRRPWGCS